MAFKRATSAGLSGLNFRLILPVAWASIEALASALAPTPLTVAPVSALTPTSASAPTARARVMLPSPSRLS
ncbi:hypothetical protein D3C72_1778450 [compost metagenome]